MKVIPSLLQGLSITVNIIHVEARLPAAATVAADLESFNVMI
jgi:hypothetical protein